ncbi:MAG: phosphotransferase [Bacteroidaceae bacterium]|nr:phosphotransferase [Bacteroidaceae bacterium]
MKPTPEAFYKTHFSTQDLLFTPLTQAGSNRIYSRVTSVSLPNVSSVIEVKGTSVEENKAFIYQSDYFSAKGLPIPRVYAVSEDSMSYVQEDLGTMALFDACAEGRKTGEYGEVEKKLLHQTIALLPLLQYEGGEGLDYSRCYPQSDFDARTILFDLNYFKYSFLKTTGLDFDEIALEDDFQRMAADLCVKDTEYTFLYRDFQARNVMLKGWDDKKPTDCKPYFIDFQGGRRGPIFYDVASFLWQAKAAYPDSLKEELILTYLKALTPYQTIPYKEFRKTLHVYVLLRTLQVLGAYGFRGYFERKPHFLESIPFAIDNLRQLLEEEAFAYPYLASLLKKLCALPQFAKKEIPTDSSRSALSIRIFSFSYKKGIPEDESGNGGGYVFDCRSTHNPGRYEPYKKITGLDPAVIKFLEDDGEITTFLESVYKLADAHVERYMARGFTDLMFSFGCTGGQHRSVYSAQHLAEYINKKYGVEIQLFHREQNIRQHFPAKTK